METIRVGTWTAYPRRNELRSRTATLRLEPRVMEVLVLLAERAGDVVTREELLSVVWAGTFVSDEVVTNAIRELRKALDDDARSPRYIQTLPKKGYRLFAPVTVRRRPRLGVHPRVVLVAAAVLATAVWWRRSVPATVPTSEPLRVTAFDGEESEPALSPDGRRVAFVSSLGGGTVGLYVKAVDGGEPLLLSQAEGEAASPAWSPDGERIAYAHFTWDGSFGHEIRIVSALGGANRRVATSKGQGAYVDWSPDAKWLASPDKASEGEPDAIYLYEVETGNKTRLSSPPSDLDAFSGDKNPRFSPDGTLVGFIRRRRSHPGTAAADIYIQPIAGRGEAKRVTFTDGRLQRFDWLPNGNGFLCSIEDRLFTVALALGRVDPSAFRRRGARHQHRGHRPRVPNGTRGYGYLAPPGTGGRRRHRTGRLDHLEPRGVSSRVLPRSDSRCVSVVAHRKL